MFPPPSFSLSLTFSLSITLSLFLSIYYSLSLFLSIDYSLYLSIFLLSITLSLFFSIYYSFSFSLPITLSLSLSPLSNPRRVALLPIPFHILSVSVSVSFLSPFTLSFPSLSSRFSVFHSLSLWSVSLSRSVCIYFLHSLSINESL